MYKHLVTVLTAGASTDDVLMNWGPNDDMATTAIMTDLNDRTMIFESGIPDLATFIRLRPSLRIKGVDIEIARLEGHVIKGR